MSRQNSEIIRHYLMAVVSLIFMLSEINTAQAKNNEIDEKAIDGQFTSVEAKCEWNILPEALKKHGDIPFVSHGEDVMCLVGKITPEGVIEAINTVHRNNINYIVITSRGGEVASAIDLAELINEKDIMVIVNGPCLSACANYIFLGARRKYVLDRGIVGWHGAPRPRKDGMSPGLQKIVERHESFFQRIGVDSRITWQVPCDLRDDPEFVEASKTVKEKRDVFWTYPKFVMEEKFNVRGIIGMWTPESGQDLRSRPAYRKVFIAEGCDE